MSIVSPGLYRLARRDEELEVAILGVNHRVALGLDEAGEVNEFCPEAIISVGVDVVALGLVGEVEGGGGLTDC